MFYVYCLICQVLYVTYRSTESQHVHLPVFRWLSDRSNEGCIVQSCGSLLLKCYAQSVNVFGCWFFFYVQTCQVPTYMCVLYRYLNLLVDLLLKVLKHWMYIHVYRCECEDQFIFSQISIYMLYSLICNRSGTLYITKNTVIVKCQGQRSLICYTLICIWIVYISFAILNKVNETEFVISLL